MASRLDFSQIRSLYIGTSASQTVPTNNVIIDGNVLLGTTTDTGLKLDVNGSARLSGGLLYLGNYSANPEIILQASNNSWSKINFYDNNSTEGLYIRTDGDVYGGTMTFGARWDDDEGKVFFKMFQSSAGAAYDVKIGVNTGSPETMLHLAKSSSSNDISGTPSIIITNRDSTSGTFVSGGIFNNPYRDVSTSSVTAGVWFENQNSPDAGALAKSSAVVFGANSYSTGWALPTERMRITQGGLVGIGTSNPLAKLHVSNGVPTGVGTLPANTTLLVDNGASDNFITIRNTSDNGTYGGFIFQDNNVGGYIAFRNYTGSGPNDGSNGDAMYYGTYTDHIFQAGTQEPVGTKPEIMRIKYTGNVLIGTTTDNGRKLNVSGDIFASGEIYSNQYAAGRYIRYNWNTTNFTVGGGTATRWVIGRIYWNQVHWGSYSGMDIEIVWNYYNGARKKYTISNGAGGGAIYLRESQSYGSAYGRVSLGSAVDTGTTSGGYSNYYQDVYLEVNEYNYVSVNGELKGPTISIDKTSISGGEYGWATFFSSPSASTISQFTSTAATILTSENNWGYIDNKLGINVSNPDYQLDVYSANTPVVRISSQNSSGVGNPMLILARGGEETFKLAVDPNVGAIFRTVVANVGYMDFFTGTDSLTLRMSGNKNLLIGTTTDPGYRLYVSGSTGGQLGSPSTNASAFNFGDTSRALAYMPTVGGGNYNVASVANGSALFNTLNSDWWVGNHDGSALRFVQNSSLVFYTNSGARGAWTGTGLGIGTTSPATRIDARDNPTSTNGVIQATPTYSGGSYFTAFRAVPSDTGDQGNYTGLFMGSISSDNALITSGSVYNSAGQYLPGGTTTTGIGLGGGTFTVFGNTGLTAGTQFAPTARMQVIGSTGNVLIGSTTDAGYKLDVYGEILGRDDIRILNTYALILNGTDANWRIGRNTITDTGWLTGNTMQMVVFGGQTGQGFQVVNTNGTALFEIDGVAGASRFTNALGVGVNPSGTSGRIDASNDIVAYSTSDQRLKENITPIANALDKVKALTGVEFDWKEDTKAVHGYEGHDVGVIAQEVQAVLPEAVRTNDSGYLSVRYEKMIALLVEANKELASRIEELEKKLK